MCIYVFFFVFTYCCKFPRFRNIYCMDVRTLSLGLCCVKIPWYDGRRLLARTIKASSLRRETSMLYCFYLHSFLLCVDLYFNKLNSDQFLNFKFSLLNLLIHFQIVCFVELICVFPQACRV